MSSEHDDLEVLEYFKKHYKKRPLPYTLTKFCPIQTQMVISMDFSNALFLSMLLYFMT